MENMVGSTALSTDPQALLDGKRIIAGYNILDCALAKLASADCTSNKVHIYPIRWDNEADGSGPWGASWRFVSTQTMCALALIPTHLRVTPWGSSPTSAA